MRGVRAADESAPSAGRAFERSILHAQVLTDDVSGAAFDAVIVIADGIERGIDVTDANAAPRDPQTLRR